MFPLIICYTLWCNGIWPIHTTSPAHSVHTSDFQNEEDSGEIVWDLGCLGSQEKLPVVSNEFASKDRLQPPETSIASTCPMGRQIVTITIQLTNQSHRTHQFNAQQVSTAFIPTTATTMYRHISGTKAAKEIATAAFKSIAVVSRNESPQVDSLNLLYLIYILSRILGCDWWYHV